jgi:poly-gamma-glutamate capsule biosynthesis protein CapA/YwtB (metallophosphatase superfamily)
MSNPRADVCVSAAKNTQRAEAGRCVFYAALVTLALSACAAEPTVSLALLGDAMLGRGVAAAHAVGGWEAGFGSLAPVLRSADFAAANLESPIGCEASGDADRRVLLAPPGAADALSAAGIDFLTMVNNHARDGGPEAAACTQAALAERGILLVREPLQPLEIDAHGVAIAILAADFVDPAPDNYLADLALAVQAAKDAGRIVVVSLHWGLEYQSGTDPLQRQIAGSLAEAGADVIWGHHPHVIQPSEWIGGTLVLYSLGNALFDQPEPALARRGDLAWVELDRSGVRGYASFAFEIDPRNGRTGMPNPRSLRISFPGNR